MSNHRTRRALAAALLVLIAAGCAKLDPLAPPTTSTGEADFSNYVAMGTSVSMGIQSAGLLDQYQLKSVPNLIAHQAGANGGVFTQPLVASPGIPNLLVLTSLSPLTFSTLPGTPPSAPYIPRPADGYDNLSISGAVVAAAIAQPTGFPYFDLVLQGQGTMLRQCIAQHPTFITVELGVNDAVRPVLQGGDLASLISVPTFATLYTQLMDSLAAGAPNARLALANIPQVTLIPYAATVPPVVQAPIGPGGALVSVRLRDAAGPLPDGTLILLPAKPLIQLGYGFPSPAPPLPDSLVITTTERSAIETAIVGFNAAIAAEAQARGAALVDEYALYDGIYRNGITIGGTHYTTAYISGGLFSLDGVHPSTLGSGILANRFLEAINARFGARIPPVDLSQLTHPPSGYALAEAGR
jgi:lysophospholipase L1-like esterase